MILGKNLFDPSCDRLGHNRNFFPLRANLDISGETLPHYMVTRCVKEYVYWPILSINEENEVNVSLCSGTLVHSLLPERLKPEVKNII